MNQPQASPKVLVAPLDWGLGHATRCIPIIRGLLQRNCQVVLAASGQIKRLLQQEFPEIQVLPLPGYEIEYASTGWGLAAKIVAQIPKLLSAIDDEQTWLQKVVEEEGIDAVISDNRYGLYHTQIPSVFLTHQLRIQAPFTLAADFLQDLNYKFINRFIACWVPDAEGDYNLAGNLSHPIEGPEVPVFYTGPLSRFPVQSQMTGGSYLLFLLSGPEPQRTLLEEKILQDLEDYPGPVVLVRGLPEITKALEVGSNVTVFPHLPAAELAATILGASLVIGRCGYSTVMDLAALKKKSILIPTPGQTEQEYLSRHLMALNFAFCVEQNKFSLKKVLELSDMFPYQPFSESKTEKLGDIINQFIQLIMLSKTEM